MLIVSKDADDEGEGYSNMADLETDMSSDEDGEVDVPYLARFDIADRIRSLRKPLVCE